MIGRFHNRCLEVCCGCDRFQESLWKQPSMGEVTCTCLEEYNGSLFAVGKQQWDRQPIPKVCPFYMENLVMSQKR